MNKCTACGHENDLTRVFCQNCGSRLERSAGLSVPGANEPDAPVSPEITRPALRKKPPGTKGGPAPRSAGAMVLRKIISTAILGAILAVIILIVRPPENLPPPAPINETAADNLLNFVQEYSQSPYLRDLVLTEEQVNGYLASKIKVAVDSGASAYKPTFKRAFVVINQGSVRVFIEQAIGGYSLYEYMDLVPKAGPAGVTVETSDAGIGRFPIPKQAAFVMQDGFSSLFGALREVQSVFATASTIELTPGRAKLLWASKKNPSP